MEGCGFKQSLIEKTDFFLANTGIFGEKSE
jgi:hypothetical protein